MNTPDHGKVFTGVLGGAGNRKIASESGEKLGDGLCLDQFPRLIQVVVHDAFRINAKAMVNRSQKFAGMNGFVEGAEPVLSDSP